MRKPKQLTKQLYPAALVFALMALLVTISGCSLGIDDPAEDLTEEDIQAASKILGESLSDETSGVMGSLNDALTTVSRTGFVRSGAAKSALTYIRDDDDNSGRGREFNFDYEYDSSTGTHTLSFKRKITKPNFSKSVTDTLKYIFTDSNGDFIARPRRNRERIDTIDFKGFREGTIELPKRNSFFNRTDSFLISGISRASNILTIDGVHHGNGYLRGTNEAGEELDRTYQLEIDFLNIELDKAITQQNQSLEQGVTGTLTWEMVIQKTTGGMDSEKTIRGTVEMNGDGTALLRFERLQKLFQINLDDGEIRDLADEFEGRVTGVNLELGTFTLANGRVVSITKNTVIEDEGDLFSLEQVAGTLENTPDIRAEGTGSVKENVFVATEVKFEVDDDSDNDEEKEFEGKIASVDPAAQTFKLESGLVIKIVDKTNIKVGDFETLSEIAGALARGKMVEAEGEGFKPHGNDSGADIDLIAVEVKFENDEDDGDDERTEEFEGSVVSADINTKTFVLENGLVIEITDDTKIDGDFKTLDALVQALGQDGKIKAIGKGIKPGDDSSSDLIATEVKFESDNANSGEED